MVICELLASLRLKDSGKAKDYNNIRYKRSYSNYYNKTNTIIVKEIWCIPSYPKVGKTNGFLAKIR